MSRGICAYLQASLNRRIVDFIAEFVLDIFGNIWLVETVDCSVELPTLPQRRYLTIIRPLSLTSDRSRSPDYKYLRTLNAIDGDTLHRSGSASKERKARSGRLDARMMTHEDPRDVLYIRVISNVSAPNATLVEFEADSAFSYETGRSLSRTCLHRFRFKHIRQQPTRRVSGRLLPL